MDNETATNIVICPTCRGNGVLSDQRQRRTACKTCYGRGTATWWAGAWWSWQQPLTTSSVIQRRTEHIIKLVINGLLMIFLGLGLFFGLPFLFSAWQYGSLLATLLDRDPNLAIFWFGLLAGLYLIYRLERDVLLFPSIPINDIRAQQPSGDPWTSTTPVKNVADIFPESSMRVLEHAWRIARERNQPEITPSHILEILSTLPAMASMIVRMGLQPNVLREKLQQHQTKQVSAAPVLSAETHALLANAFMIAAEHHQDRVQPPALMAAVGSIDSPARNALFDLGLDEQKLKHVMDWLLIQDDLRNRLRRYRKRAALKPKGAIDRGYTASASPILSRFSTDLTIQARNGGLPYVIGRDDELKKVFRVMESGRRSVMLLGDSGVGKTNLLYAMAERMVTEDVPDSLQDKRLVSLSAAALVSGAGAVGQLEERVTAIVHELIRAGNTILAIEDFDQLIGVSSSGGGLDAAHIIAQELQRGSFLVIATATPTAYRRIIEPSGTQSGFETVNLQEMNTEEAIVAIESRIAPLEVQHKVFFTYDAIDASVRLAQRYLHEKTLPGNALEVLNEAATLAYRSRGQNSLVLKDDVESIVTEQSKVNVKSVSSTEQTKLLNLEQEIHQRIIGQDEAVKAVSNALRRARAEIRDTNRPIASFLFLGPTGVGKTELAKTVAAVYFGAETTMVRIDMSEYQEITSLDRLIGNPQLGSGGQLTDAVRTKPFTLVLLDELEKAHPDILNLFLQVMDDGRLTDASGRTVDFTNTIIIATSNAGTQHIQNRMREGAALETIKQELINQELQQYYRPEFLNRFDAIVVFTPLSPIQVVKIVSLMIEQVAKQLATKGITFKATPEAVAELAQQGFDPTFGARPLRRAVQEKVDDALAKFLLQGKLGRRDVAVLQAGGEITVQKASADGS